MSVISESLQQAVLNGFKADPLPPDVGPAFADYLDKCLAFSFLRDEEQCLLDADKAAVDRAERRFKLALGLSGVSRWSFGGHVWSFGNYGVEKVS